MKICFSHDWQRINGTERIYECGMSKNADYECTKCGKKKLLIFAGEKRINMFLESSVKDK